MSLALISCYMYSTFEISERPASPMEMGFSQFIGADTRQKCKEKRCANKKKKKPESIHKLNVCPHPSILPVNIAVPGTLHCAAPHALERLNADLILVKYLVPAS